MKVLRLIGGVLLLLFAGIVQADIAGDNELTKKLEAEVRNSLDRFSRAYAEADVNTLEQLLVEDYWHTNTNGGVVSRENWLGWNRSRQEQLLSGKAKISRYENRDIKIKVLSPDVAVVTGINSAAGFRNGADYELNIRFTHVWRKIDAIWKRAVFHDSKIE